MNCLVVDIGNTSTSVGLALGRRIVHVARVERHPASAPKIRSILEKALAGKRVRGSVVASVVPEATPRWTRSLEAVTGKQPLVVTHGLELGIEVDYPAPVTIGADRLANAGGAVARHGSPVIVADFGTALTFDVVVEKGVYVGGVIAPGLPLMTDYLAEKTALLPRIRLAGRCHRVGRSTAGAMRIGAHIGYRGMVREIVNYLTEQWRTPFALCATGGFARWALDGLDIPFCYDPNLTLFGLSRIFALNVKT